MTANNEIVRPTDVPSLLTPGRIASELCVPLHRVLRILRTREHIRPRARAGTIRLYRSETIAQVRHELHAQDAKRAERKGMTT